MRRESFRNAREAADVAEHHRHFALLAAQLQIAGIGDNPPHHFGREIAVEGAVDECATAFLAQIGGDRDRCIDRDQAGARPQRVDEKSVAVERIPAAAKHRANREKAGKAAPGGTDHRQCQRQRKADDEQRDAFRPACPVGPHEKPAREDLLGGLRMDRNAERTVLDRRRDQIAQADCARADENDAPCKGRFELARRHRVLQQPPGRDRARRLRRRVVQPQLARMRRWYLELPHLDRDDIAAVSAGFAACVARLDDDRASLLRDAQRLERQAREKLRALLGDQRRATDDSIGIADRADEAGAGRGCVETGQRDDRAREGRQIARRRAGNGKAGLGRNRGHVFVACQEVTEHDRQPVEALRERGIGVGQAHQRLAHRSIGHALGQPRWCGTISLRKHDVISDDGGTRFTELGRQLSDLVARPRPLAHAADRLVVDVEDADGSIDVVTRRDALIMIEDGKPGAVDQRDADRLHRQREDQHAEPRRGRRKASDKPACAADLHLFVPPLLAQPTARR